MAGRIFRRFKANFANEVSLQFPAMACRLQRGEQAGGHWPIVPTSASDYAPTFCDSMDIREPPMTWDELEIMAARIQAGERAKGKKPVLGLVVARGG